MLLILRRRFDQLMILLTGLSCLTLFIVVTVSSISRYAFNAPLLWSEEVARYAMIYGTMFGATLAFNRSQHLRFTILTDLLGRRHSALVQRFADFSVLLVGAILLVSGFRFVALRGAMESTGIGMPMGYAYAAIAIGGGCLLLAGLLDLLTLKRGHAPLTEIDGR